MRVRFVVPSVPVAQPRQRHRAFVAGGHIRTQNYTPAKHPVNAFKAAVVLAFHAVVGDGPPTTDHVAVSVTFVLPRPKALMWKSRAMPRQRHGHKPDCENLAKSCLDALTAAGAWMDDAQVSDLIVRKRIASGDEAPHAEIALRTLDAAVSMAEVRRAAKRPAVRSAGL